MNGKDYIMLKQQRWAKRNGLELLPGAVGRDDIEKNYLGDIALNLFEPLSESSVASFEKGKGNEIQDDGGKLAKMKAIHSSSALAVNLFQYWQREGGARIPSLLSALMPAGLLPKTSKAQSFNRIEFEEQFEVIAGRIPPHLDAVLHGQEHDIAVEAKFTEPYSGKHDGLKAAYIEKADLWEGMSALYELAKEMSPDNNKFALLDAAQLVKHILGLKKNAGSRGFCLLYLWYDVFGEEGVRHRAEIEQFAKIAQEDGIQFAHTTYQEVIVRMAKKSYEGNEAYCDYMIDRYL